MDGWPRGAPSQTHRVATSGGLRFASPRVLESASFLVRRADRAEYCRLYHRAPTIFSRCSSVFLTAPRLESSVRASSLNKSNTCTLRQHPTWSSLNSHRWHKIKNTESQKRLKVIYIHITVGLDNVRATDHCRLLE